MYCNIYGTRNETLESSLAGPQYVESATNSLHSFAKISCLWLLYRCSSFGAGPERKSPHLLQIAHRWIENLIPGKMSPRK